MAELRRLDADVFCLQEVLDFQLDAIVEALPEYNFIGVGRDDGVRAGEFVPVFYRGLSLRESGTFWLSDRPDVEGAIDWGARLPRICTWAKLNGLLIANVHLDHESELARANGVKLVVSRLNADVICGDFNAEPHERAIKQMVSAGYTNLGDGLGGTFNGFDSEPASPPQIDYIFAKPPLSGAAQVVRDVLVSDHWAVVADLNV